MVRRYSQLKLHCRCLYTDGILTTDVVDTGEKLTTCVNDIRGHIFPRHALVTVTLAVNDTSSGQWQQYQIACNLKWALYKKKCKQLHKIVSARHEETSCLKFFSISLEKIISLRIFEIFQLGKSGSRGKMIHKKPETKSLVTLSLCRRINLHFAS